MEILFLTEGGEGIGMGHISRCSALADGFLHLGHTIKMHIRGKFQSLNNLNNYNYNKTEWFKEIELHQLIKSQKIVIVDSYLAPQKILTQIANTVPAPVFLIDSKLNYHPKGIVLFPSVYAKKFSHKFNENVHLLSGKEFLLFSKNMWNLPAFKVKNDIQKVGISLGGYVNEDIEKQVCNAIQTAFKDAEINIFGNSKQTVINQPQIKIHGFIPKEEYVNKLFDNDILIVNGGQSLNEAIVVGIPSVAITVAENQFMNAKAWENCGLTTNINSKNEGLTNELINTLNKYKCFEYRKKLNLNASITLTAKGAVNAAKQIFEFIKIR